MKQLRNAGSGAREIRLRAIEPEDLDLLYRIENDPELWGVGPTSVPYSRYALHDYVAHAEHDIWRDGQVRLVVENQEGQAVGLADLTSFDAKHLRAEVGLVIERPFRRQGYGLATLTSLAAYARRVVHLHQLYAVIDTANAPSRQLFLRSGYQPTATLTQWLYDGTTFRDAIVMQLTV